VPLDGEARVVGLHPLPVVFDRDLFLSTELDEDRQTPGARIDRVLDQFLDDGGGPFDHLTGGDLIREVTWEKGDATHFFSFQLSAISFQLSLNELPAAELKADG
jgi:hypothetical protein